MKRLGAGLAASCGALSLAGRLSVQPRMPARYWSPDEGAGSSYSSNWRYNYFFKQGRLRRDGHVHRQRHATAGTATVRGTGSTYLTTLLARLQREARRTAAPTPATTGQLHCHRLRGGSMSGIKALVEAVRSWLAGCRRCGAARERRDRWAVQEPPIAASFAACDGNRPMVTRVADIAGGGWAPGAWRVRAGRREAGISASGTHLRRPRRSAVEAAIRPTTRSAGSAVSASLAYEGGPAIEGVRDARLFGLAAARRGECQRAHERRERRARCS